MTMLPDIDQQDYDQYEQQRLQQELEQKQQQFTLQQAINEKIAGLQSVVGGAASAVSGVFGAPEPASPTPPPAPAPEPPAEPAPDIPAPTPAPEPPTSWAPPAEPAPAPEAPFAPAPELPSPAAPSPDVGASLPRPSTAAASPPPPVPPSGGGGNWLQDTFVSGLNAIEQAGGNAGKFAQQFQQTLQSSPTSARDLLGPAFDAAEQAGADVSQFANNFKVSSPPPSPVAAAPGGANDMVSYIRQAAQQRGIDPDIAVTVANHEGLNTYVGDQGSSFGPFQLHYGGVAKGGNAVSGLGDAFTKQTGLDARDPSTWQAQVDFALDNVASNGWGAFHGAAAAGIGNRDGIGGVRGLIGRATDTVRGVASGVANQVSQFGDKQLTADEAYAACGPAAAVRFAQAYGRNPTLREATDLAKQVGWTAGGGMAGISSEQKLMDKLGIPTKLVPGAQWAQFATEAMTGNPVTISTQGHYFLADGYDPSSGAFHVGRSGTDLRQGAEWMTPQQMTSVMGPVQGALFADNPLVPGTSAADSGRGGLYMGTMQSADNNGLSPLDQLGGGIGDVFSGLGTRARQTQQSAEDILGSAAGTLSSDAEALSRGARNIASGADDVLGISARQREIEANRPRGGDITSDIGSSLLEQGNEARSTIAADQAAGNGLADLVIDGAKQQGWNPSPEQERFAHTAISQLTPANVAITAVTAGGAGSLRALAVEAALLGASALGTAGGEAIAPNLPDWAQPFAPFAGSILAPTAAGLGIGLGRAAVESGSAGRFLRDESGTLTIGGGGEPHGRAPRLSEGATPVTGAGMLEAALADLDRYPPHVVDTVREVVGNADVPASTRASVIRQWIEENPLPSIPSRPSPALTDAITAGLEDKVARTRINAGGARMEQGQLGFNETDFGAQRPQMSLLPEGPDQPPGSTPAFSPEKLLPGYVPKSTIEAQQIADLKALRAKWQAEREARIARGEKDLPNSDYMQTNILDEPTQAPLRAPGEGVFTPEMLLPDYVPKSALEARAAERLQRIKDLFGEARAQRIARGEEPLDANMLQPSMFGDEVQFPLTETGGAGQSTDLLDKLLKDYVPKSEVEAAQIAKWRRQLAEGRAARTQRQIDAGAGINYETLSNLLKEGVQQELPLTPEKELSMPSRVMQILNSNMLIGPHGLLYNVLTQGEQAGRQPLIRLMAGYGKEALKGVEMGGAAAGDSIADMWHVIKTGEAPARLEEASGSRISKLAPGVRLNVGADAGFRHAAGMQEMAMEAAHLASLPENAGKHIAEVMTENLPQLQKAYGRGGNAAVFAESGGSKLGSWLSSTKSRLINSQNPNMLARRGEQTLGWLLWAGVPFSHVPEVIWNQGLRRAPGISEAVGSAQVVRALAKGDIREARLKGAETVLDGTINFALISAAAGGNLTAGNDPEHPWSVRLPGDNWVDYRNLGPLGIRMGVIASIMEARNEDSNKLSPNTIVSAINKTASFAENQQFLAGAVSLIGKMGNNQAASALGNEITQLGDRLVPAGALANYIEKSTDPVMRDVSKGVPGAWERQMSRIPGMAELLPTQPSTTTGQAKERLDYGPVRALTGVQTSANDPAGAEMARLKRKGYAVNPPPTDTKSITVGNAEIPLSDAERRVYLAARGQRLADAAANVMNTPEYQAGGDSDAAENGRAAMWSKAISSSETAGRAALEAMIGENEMKRRMAAGRRSTGRLMPVAP